MDGFDTFGWCLRVLITDIYSCLHDIPNAGIHMLKPDWLALFAQLGGYYVLLLFFFPWQLNWQVYSGSCLFFPFFYPKKYDAMSLGSHERARYRSICYLWFRWSHFGVDWSIIQKLRVLHMNVDCFSCSQPSLLTLFSKSDLKMQTNHAGTTRLYSFKSMWAFICILISIVKFTLRYFPHLYVLSMTVLTLWLIAPPKMFCNWYRI